VLKQQFSIFKIACRKIVYGRLTACFMVMNLAGKFDQAPLLNSANHKAFILDAFGKLGVVLVIE